MFSFGFGYTPSPRTHRQPQYVVPTAPFYFFYFIGVQLTYNAVVPFYFKEYFFSKKKKGSKEARDGGRKEEKETAEGEV